MSASFSHHPQTHLHQLFGNLQCLQNIISLHDLYDLPWIAASYILMWLKRSHRFKWSVEYCVENYFSYSHVLFCCRSTSGDPKVTRRRPDVSIIHWLFISPKCCPWDASDVREVPVDRRIFMMSWCKGSFIRYSHTPRPVWKSCYTIIWEINHDLRFTREPFQILSAASCLTWYHMARIRNIMLCPSQSQSPSQVQDAQI